MRNDIDRIYCAICKKRMLDKDRISIDNEFTLRHLRCYPINKHEVKDIGTYSGIIEKYGLLDDDGKEGVTIKS